MNMKKTIGLLSLMALLLFTACSGGSEGGTAKAEFFVSGYCDMCKDKIEGALTGAPGVVSATWSTESRMAVVEYDSSKTNTMDLHKVVSEVGYSTEKVEAVPAAYAALPKCCKKPEDR